MRERDEGRKNKYVCEGVGKVCTIVDVGEKIVFERKRKKAIHGERS